MITRFVKVFFATVATIALSSCVTATAPNSLVPISVGPVDRIGGQPSREINNSGPVYRVIEKRMGGITGFYIPFYSSNDDALDTHLVEISAEGHKVKIKSFIVQSLSWNFFAAALYTGIRTDYSTESEGELGGND